MTQPRATRLTLDPHDSGFLNHAPVVFTQPRAHVPQEGSPQVNISPLAVVSDPLQGLQWHIKNTGQAGGVAGVDIDVTRAWADYTGRGVRIGIIDEGIDYTHSDLRANYNTALDRDFADNDFDAMAMAGNNHGTAVAGVIAADNNGAGLVGIAPDSQIAGLRVSYSGGTIGMFTNALASMKQFDVVNNSWGYVSPFSDNLNQSYFAGHKAALISAVSEGRGGLGTNIVFAAGNAAGQGDNVNYHGLQNSSYTISVGALDQSGRAASFSNQGSALLVSAPGVQIATTDGVGANGYVSGDYVYVSGTSFAAPIVSGVIALMLEANSKLGYRDVQEILAYSARKVDNANPAWLTNKADNWNGGGLHYSHAVGFGIVDAHTAVRLAETWQEQSTYANLTTVTGSSTARVAIPDTGVAASSTISISQNILIDRVEVTLNISHAAASQLDIYLISAEGTRSQLVDNAPISGGLPVFTFNTVASWGETSAGTWRLEAVDRVTGTAGFIQSWSLNILGDVITPNNTYYFTDEFAGLSTAAYRLYDRDGGVDTINAAAVTGDITLDLRGASGSISGRAFSTGGAVIENIFTGDGRDVITGSNVNNVIRTGRGNDVINESTGQDVIDGGAGTDRFVSLAMLNHTYTLNSATDITLYSRTSTDSVRLTNIEEFTFGLTTYTMSSLLQALNVQQATAMTLSGSDTKNQLTGGDNNDTLFGGAGNDTIFGGAGHDIIWGGLGNDIMYGGAGNDTLYGESGNDTLRGGLGNDILYGDAGNDTLIAGAGADTLYGGTGRNVFALTVADNQIDMIYDFQATGGGADKLNLTNLISGFDPGENINDFVHFIAQGSTTRIEVSANGTSNGFVHVASISGAALGGSAQSYVDSGLLITNQLVDP